MEYDTLFFDIKTSKRNAFNFDQKLAQMQLYKPTFRLVIDIVRFGQTAPSSLISLLLHYSKAFF